MRTRSTTLRLVLGLTLLLLEVTACGGSGSSGGADDVSGADAATDGASGPDAAAVDVSGPDGAPVDAAPVDGTAADGTAADAPGVDGDEADAVGMDAARPDTGADVRPDCGEAGCAGIGCTTDDDCAGSGRGDYCEPGSGDCVRCLSDAHCAGGETCTLARACELPCGADDACPEGRHCVALESGKKLCRVKACESDGDCADPFRPHCDSVAFACVEEPIPDVAPEVAYFRASPPVVPAGVEVPVTLTFAFANTPRPLPTCTIDGGVGAVELTEEPRQEAVTQVATPGPFPTPTQFTLTCENPAGTAEATVTVAAVVPAPLSAVLPSAGGTVRFGPYSLEVPPDAVSTDTTITVSMATEFAADPDFFGPVLDFQPEGLTFHNPLVLTLPYDPALMAAAGWAGLDPEAMRIGVARSAASPWRRWETEVDPVAGTLIAKISHFSEAGAQQVQRPTGWHPLRGHRESGVAELLQQDELLMETSAGASTLRLVDDQRHDFATLRDFEFDAEREFLLDGASGDVDGDGREELVKAYLWKRAGDTRKEWYAIRVEIWGWSDAEGLVREGLFDSTDAVSWGNSDSFYRVSVALAAVEGDATEKRVVIAGSYGDYHTTAGTPDLDTVRNKRDGVVWVLRRVEAAGTTAYVPEESDTFTSMLHGTWDVDVAAGDVDGDGKDELVFAGRDPVSTYGQRSIKVWVRDDADAGYVQLVRLYNASGSVLTRSSETDYASPQVVVAPFDGDRKDEIALGALDVDGSTIRVELFNDHGANYAVIGTQERYESGVGTWRETFPGLQMVAVDLNRNDIYEIVAAFEGHEEDTMSAARTRAKLVALHWPFARADENTRFTSTPTRHVEQVMDSRQGDAGVGRFALAAGSLRRDGKDQYFLAYQDVDRHEVEVVQRGGTRQSSGKWSVSDVAPSWSLPAPERQTQPGLVAGDVDGDSTRLRFTGRVTKQSADPMIMVVMATAPYVGNSDQGTLFMGTSYGETRTETTSETSEINLKAGVEISWSGKDPFGIVEAEVSAALEYECKRSNTNEESWSYGSKETIGADTAGGGAVIFTAQTYDSYEYEVLSHTDPDYDPDDPDNRFLTIDDPNYEPKKHRQSIEYFNANNGGPDIGEETFRHEIGSPATYPTRQEKDDLVESYDGWSYGPFPVREGDGFRTESVTLGAATGSSTSHSWGVTFSAGLKTGPLGMKASVGVGGGSTYEVVCGTETEYEGVVGDMMEDYGAHSFDWGMMVYDLERDDFDGLRYQVVDYWVEGCEEGRCDNLCVGVACGDCEVCAGGECEPAPNGDPCTDDGDPCSAEMCLSGTCMHLRIADDCGTRACGPAPNGCGDCGTCADDQLCGADGQCQDACATVECPVCQVCAAGDCVPVGDGAACGDDGDVCTMDECASGACSHPPAPNDCGARVCGPSPSGCAECGACQAGEACGAEGQCAPSGPPGCDGVPGSGLVFDDCGVCGGDNPDCRVATTTLVFDDAQYGAGGLPVHVYYPAYVDGADVDVSMGSFPVLVFGHGYQQSYGDYAYVWEALVPRGYLAVFPDKLSGDASIDIDAYADDLAFLLEKMQQLGADAGSRFHGHVAPTSALMGHSTGGGADFLAASLAASEGTQGADTVVALAPLGELTGTPVSGTAPAEGAASLSVPALILDGGEDCVTPPAENSEPIYDAIPAGVRKVRVTILQGDHCGFGDPDGPGRTECESAEYFYDTCYYGLPVPTNHQGPTLGPAVQSALALDYLAPWLDAHLKDDPAAWALFEDRLSDPAVASERAEP